MGWKLFTRRGNFENQPDKPQPLSTPGPPQNVVPKGITAVLDASPSANVAVQTAGGTYTFPLDVLKRGGVLTFADGDVTVQPVPAPTRVSPARPGPNAVAEHDNPSLAVARDGSVWIAWQGYQDGGDHVFVAHSVAGGWSAPEALTAGGQDVFRTAIAEDSRGRVWVVWPQREGKFWDLTARTYDGRSWSAPRKLTNGNRPNFSLFS